MLEISLTILGITLLLAPFLLVLLCNDKIKGFIYIFALTTATHLVVALVTQWAGIFSYGLILCVHSVIVVSCIVYILRNRKNISHPRVRFNWFVACISIIAILLLSSIHFYYTGVVDADFAGLQSVSKSSYAYPFYSDEWMAVSFMDYSIKSQSLPFVNPLRGDTTPFINLTAGFYALLAEVALLLHVDPLVLYVFFAILNGLLVSFFIYQILRCLHVGPSISSVAAVSVLFMTHSGNLPGIWNLLPYSLALTFFLVSLLGVIRDYKIVSLIAAGISCILYPPIGLFIVPLLCAYVLMLRRTDNVFSTKSALLQACGALAIPICIVLVLGVSTFTGGDLLLKIQSLIFRKNLEGGITAFAIWNVVPLFTLPFILVGIVATIRRKIMAILLPVGVGIFFWVLYSFVQFVFVIEPARVVVITATLLMVVFGIGLNTVIQSSLFTRYISTNDPVVLQSLKMGTALFFGLLAVFHTHLWVGNKLVLVLDTGDRLQEFVPAPPVTRYLHKEDLRIFKNIKGKNFLSSPWKGLVVGVATRNYPLDSKASTISNNTFTLAEFLRSDCIGKIKSAKKYKIDYVYGSPFTCEGFELVDKSTEGFYLYKYIGQPLVL